MTKSRHFSITTQPIAAKFGSDMTLTPTLNPLGTSEVIFYKSDMVYGRYLKNLKVTISLERSYKYRNDI